MVRSSSRAPDPSPAAPQALLTPRYPAGGIDPGRTGAAALLDAPDALSAVLSWTPQGDDGATRYRVFSMRRLPDGTWRHDLRIIPDRPGAVGLEIARVFREAGGAGAVLACEDVYLGKNAQTLIGLARWTGGVVAPTEELYGRSALWVRADEWRAPVLGLRRGTARAVAKAASLRYLPARVRGVDDVLTVIGRKADHVTDAVGIAVWAATCSGGR